jgi:hypothetical protein
MAYIVDRKLPDRTKLMFYYPKPTEESDYYVVGLPFFENVSIKESKKARYKKYSLISRSSDLYSYLGANSRQLSLAFTITLPHIVDLHDDITLDKYINYQSDKENFEAEKKKFLKPYEALTGETGMAFKLGTKYTQDLAKDTAKTVLMNATITNSLNLQDKHFIQSRYGISEGDMNTINTLGNVTKNWVGNPLSTFDGAATAANVVNAQEAAQKEAKLNIENNQDLELRYRIIDIIIYWTNIIRSSVVNYSKNPIYGPPIIRLRHGIMYQDIPCICTAYSIDYDEAAGYDVNTLLPRRIKYTMKLEEIRTGDFGEFDPADIIKKDNLAGWEAVVTGDTHSMDPGYGGIL